MPGPHRKEGDMAESYLEPPGPISAYLQPPTHPPPPKLLSRIVKWILSKDSAVGVFVTYATSAHVYRSAYNLTLPMYIINGYTFSGLYEEHPRVLTVIASIFSVCIFFAFRRISAALGALLSIGIAAAAYLGWATSVALLQSDAVLSKESNLVGTLSLVPVVISFGLYEFALRYRARVATLASAPHSEPGLPSLIANLRSRASQLRHQAAIILTAIVAAIGLGIWIFVRAESFGRMASIDSQIESLTRKLDQDDSAKASFEIASNERKFSKKQKAGIREYLGKLDREKRATVERLVGELRAIKNTPAFLPDSRFETYLVSTLSTRVGIILLLVFFVQILVSLYRYSTKLASVYSMHADALTAKELLPGARIEQLIAFFASQNVDFGATPKAPVEAFQQHLKDTLGTVQPPKNTTSG